MIEWILADVEGDEAAAWQHHIQAAWYRLLYVAQAIAAYSKRNYQRPGSREADLFLHTSRTAKQLMDTLEADIRKFWEDLERTRHKLQVRRPLPGRSAGGCSITA